MFLRELNTNLFRYLGATRPWHWFILSTSSVIIKYPISLKALFFSLPLLHCLSLSLRKLYICLFVNEKQIKTVYNIIYIYIRFVLYCRSTKTQSRGIQLLQNKLTFDDQISEIEILFSYFLFKETVIWWLISHSLADVNKTNKTKTKNI